VQVSPVQLLFLVLQPQENPQRQETALGKQQIPQLIGISFEEKDDKLFEGKSNT
jgi:hypothetical protein